MSHTWKSSSRLKIWSLTLQEGWHCIVVSWLVCTILAASLCASDVLPATWYFEVKIHTWLGWGFHSPWIRLSGLLGFAIGLLTAAYWPSWPLRPSDLAFVDVVSIDQGDPHLTQQGVYGLGGFLALSSELRVLWSAPLFSRLWCVFELAAFRKANPKGKIVLAPLYQELLVGCVLMWLLFMMVLHFLLHQLAPAFAFLEPLGLLPIIFCIHSVRKIMSEKRRLLANLKKFDLSLAECQSDYDRRFIYAGIHAWYGSHEAFTEYVRGPVFQELVAPLATFQLPLRYWTVIALFELSSLLEFTVSFIRGGAPVDVVLAQLLASVISQVLFRIVAMSLGLFLSDRCGPSFSCGCLVDFLKTFCIFLVVVAFLYASFQVTAIAQSYGLASSAACACIAVLGAAFALGACSTQHLMDWRRPRP